MGREDTSFHAFLYHDDDVGGVDVVVVADRRCRYNLAYAVVRCLLINDNNGDDRR